MMFQVDCGRYPTSEEGLAALLNRPPAIQEGHWRGPYLDVGYLDMGNVRTNPWGQHYIYRFPGVHNTNGYDLYSLAPIGQGTDGVIGNWPQPK